MGKKGGRPRKAVTEEMREKARELFGRYPIRSKVATLLAAHFHCGRPLAYKAIAAALEEYKSELAGTGKVDALTLAYAVFTNVMGSETARDRERIQAAMGLVKLLGVKAFKDMGEAGDVEEFLRRVGLRREQAEKGKEPVGEGED